jgi:hypothetical protein
MEGMKVFENRILSRIFEPKRDENGEWRSPQNEEIHVCTIRLILIFRAIKSRRCQVFYPEWKKVGVLPKF